MWNDATPSSRIVCCDFNIDGSTYLKLKHLIKFYTDALNMTMQAAALIDSDLFSESSKRQLRESNIDNDTASS